MRVCLALPKGIARWRGNNFDRKWVALGTVRTLVTKQGEVRFVFSSGIDSLLVRNASR